MKNITIIVIMLFLFFQTPVFSQGIDTYIEGEDFFNSSVENLTSGNFSLSPGDVFNYILDLLTKEFESSKKLILCIFVIALIAGIFNVVKQNDKSTNDAAFFVCYCLISIACAKLVTIAVGYGTDVIDEMSTFITKIAPLLSLLLAAGGYTSSAAVYYPVFSASVYLVSTIIDKCIVPLIYIGCVTGIINNLSGKSQLNNFSRIIKSFSKWILAAILTIFSGINAIYGFCTPTVDNLIMKTAKFAVGSIVPVVGSFLSESIETVIGSTRLMKNAVGTAGIISVIVICAVPIIKIAAIMLMLKISASLIEPISDKRFSDMLMEIADSVTTVFAMLIIVAILFIISIAIIISSTNITM